MMADLKDEVADLGEKAIGFASNLFKRSTEVARQQARIVGLQTQIMRLRDDKTRLYSLMGQKVYALYEKGLVKNADLLTLCEQAGDLEQQVEAAETEIQQLRTGVEVRMDVQDTEGGVEAEPESDGGTAQAAGSAPPTGSNGDVTWLPPSSET
jgi:predicted  nucleic acid-binding Zn-ribbon protein